MLPIPEPLLPMVIYTIYRNVVAEDFRKKSLLFLPGLWNLWMVGMVIQDWRFA